MDVASLIARQATGTYAVLRRAALGYVKGRATPDRAVGTAVAWQASHVYAAGARVSNDSGRLYYCTTGGTSAASTGPTGTAADITDGTVHWQYVGVTLAIVAAVAPTRGDDLLRLPEGRRLESTYTVYTATELTAGGQAQGTEADLVTIEGLWWEVQAVAPWVPPGGTGTGYVCVVQMRATT